jgi:predicted ArsR family transcriptional regulator
MSIKKDHERMDKLDKCFSLVQQSSAKGGINAIELSKKLGVHRTTAHSYLTSLDLAGKVESRGGLWFAKTGEQTIKPLEKEIVIELPIPRNEVRRMVLLEQSAKDFGKFDDDNIFRTMLEKEKEARTIRIIGRNVDDLDLEKVTKLIEQANEKSFSNGLRKIFTNLKKSTSHKSTNQSSET